MKTSMMAGERGIQAEMTRKERQIFPSPPSDAPSVGHIERVFAVHPLIRIGFGLQPPIIIEISVFLAGIAGGKQSGEEEEREIFHEGGDFIHLF